MFSAVACHRGLQTNETVVAEVFTTVLNFNMSQDKVRMFCVKVGRCKPDCNTQWFWLFYVQDTGHKSLWSFTGQAAEMTATVCTDSLFPSAAGPTSWGTYNEGPHGSSGPLKENILLRAQLENRSWGSSAAWLYNNGSPQNRCLQQLVSDFISAIWSQQGCLKVYNCFSHIQVHNSIWTSI